MRKLAVLLGFLACGAAMAGGATWEDVKKSGTLRIASEGAFPPFNFFKQGKLCGFEIDLANEISKRLGLSSEWKSYPFDSLLIGLNQGRYDLVAASHAVTAER